MSATMMKTPVDTISPEEWNVRVDLAACYRLFIHFGWTDIIFTHLTARVPGHTDQYLINPYGLLFHEITASNLLKVDFDGNVLSGDYPVNEAGHEIHTAALKARPDINAALHSHTRAGMAVSCMEEGLLPLTQQANESMELVCYHDYGLATESEEECRRLGEDLSDGSYIMFMRNHGLLTVGRSVSEAFYYMYTIENACKVQVDVMASQAKYVVPNDQALAGLARWGAPPPDKPVYQSEMAWSALLRLLDSKDASYKT